ncbi:Ig-like domain-containing protein [Microbacterium sp. NPDC019599]|uniref:Ig-like domain-containing protein n=1 Tax=Microbacterium sp. NPDC019599 TaxID=3154690 RepID=UPI0033DA4E6D
MSHSAQGIRSQVSRRGFLTLAAGGVGGIMLAGSALPAMAATPSPAPRLPGEYYRKASQLTTDGTLFDNIVVRINGDQARLFVPQTVKPYSGVPVPVVWFYHGSNSDHNALEGGFKTSALDTVDRGAIAICQTAGGTLYSHPTAVDLQIAGFSYMSGLFTISTNVLRSTSGGGALATETYARGLVSNISGMYNVNSTYDIRAHYDAGGGSRDSIVAAFGDDPAAIDAANPARHPRAAWTGSRLRIVVSQPNESDQIVPPDKHGLALRDLALPVAAEASLRTHANGHSTPGFAAPDFVDAMNRWGVPVGGGTPTVDTQPPVVSFLAPANNSTVSGTVNVRVAATDDIGVVDVGIFLGTRRIASAARISDTEWGLSFNTRSSASPNGTYVVTARATDAAGNVGQSAPLTLRIQN